MENELKKWLVSYENYKDTVKQIYQIKHRDGKLTEQIAYVALKELKRNHSELLSRTRNLTKASERAIGEVKWK